MQSLIRGVSEFDISFYSSPRYPDSACWKKLIAGLRMDGFEVAQPDMGDAEYDIFGNSRRSLGLAELKRTLPDSIPDLSSREAEDGLKHFYKKMASKSRLTN